jgi:molybdate transport system substrate-binding protein
MVKRSERIIFIVITAFTVALLLLHGISCSAPPSTLTIFAAAGAKPPLDEICLKYDEQSQAKIEINYGGGGEVLNQMVLSRSGDIYVAPEQSFMETANEKHAIEPQTIRT